MLLYRQAFHAQRKCLRPFMAELGLAPGQPKVLLYLPATMAVCRRTSRSTVTLSRPQQAVLDTLEKNGFIVRKTMEGNRRAGSILITEKGREVVEKWVGHCHGGGGFHG